MQKQSSHKILIAFLLNLGFSIFEFFGGFFTGSVAISSDAIHDLGDALSIGISYFLERYSKKSPDDKYTYGYARYSVMGGLLTTLILVAGSIIVIYTAVLRLANPAPVDYSGMIILAIIGVLINGAAAFYTSRGKSLNQKSVNLHMLEDVLGWVVVLIGAIVMNFTNLPLLDPILSILVALFILISSLKNLKSILDLFLEKAPTGISADDIKAHVLEVKGVKSTHHLHIWSLDGIQNYATMHIVVDNLKHDEELKRAIRAELSEHGISHVTIELELANEHCPEEKCSAKLSAAPAHTHHH